MRILGGTKAATSGAEYLWVKPSKQTGNWEASLPYFLKAFSAIILPVSRPNVLPLGQSEDVRQRKPYSGLLVLDKQKYEADKILSRAHPIRNLSTTISNLKHVLRDVRPELNLCFQGSN